MARVDEKVPYIVESGPDPRDSVADEGSSQNVTYLEPVATQTVPITPVNHEDAKRPSIPPDVPEKPSLKELVSRWAAKRWRSFLKEWQLIRWYWWLILIGIIGELAHSWGAKFVYYLYGVYNVENQPVLVDFGYQAFAFIPQNLAWVPELFEFSLMGFVVLFGLSPIFMKRDFYGIHLLNRIFIITLSALVGRIVAFLVTILPSPAAHCRAGSPNFAPPTSAFDIFLHVNALDGCGDLVFSGHTLFATTFWLMYVHYGKSLAIKVVSFFWLIAMALMIIAAQHHYSVDVWLALFITPWIYLTYETYWLDFKPPGLVAMEKEDEEEELRQRSKKGAVEMGAIMDLEVNDGNSSATHEEEQLVGA